MVGEMPAPEPLAGLCAAFLYTGPGRAMLAGLKYRNQRASVGWLAAAMAKCVGEPECFAALTWAPTSPRRRRRRGFDQAELLARAVGKKLGLPVVSLLKRLDGAGQTGLNREQRFGAIQFKFVARRVPSGAVLLLDDVVTTGATLQAATRVLLQVGVPQVHGLVAAATPLPYSRPAPCQLSGAVTMRAHSKS